MKASHDKGATSPPGGAADVARVLSALLDRGLDPRPHREDPIRWDTPCPICGGTLELRDVNWQDGDRRVVSFCRRDDERAILEALGLRERDLFLDGAPPRGADRKPATRRATIALIDRLTEALGEPVATPERVRSCDGKLDRAHYRVFRWRCPACLGGYDDPTYKPLVVDSGGRVWCEAPGCFEEALADWLHTLAEAAV